MSIYYEPHLYMICYPNSALVLSQLTPEKFGFRYNYGSSSYYSGKLIFAELDINYRNDYFRIDEALAKMKAHDDGTPKATSYVSSYRIMEHVDIDAVKTLYLANSDGSCYPLTPGEYTQADDETGKLKIFAEITPLRMLSLSKFDMRQFGEWFTSPDNRLSVPRLMYLQLTMNVDEFLKAFEMDPFISPPLSGVHPAKLRNAILDMYHREEKVVKSLTLDVSFVNESYKKIKYGVMLKDPHKEKFFPMPPMTEIQDENIDFWKSM